MLIMYQKNALKRSTAGSMYAPLSLRLLNSQVRFGRSIGLRIWELDGNDILDRARGRTGLDDFGDDRYFDVLDRLIDNAQRAELTPLGERMILYFIERSAMNRLRIEDYVQGHPEVEDVRIESPLFVTGFPRSGTTLLQNVLSLGPGDRALRLWELVTPYPLHDDREKDKRMRVRKVALLLRLVNTMGPEITHVVHDTSAETKEECWLLLMNSLFVVGVDMMTGLHEWNDWLLAMDRRWVFEDYKRMLQLMAHVTPTERFVLKCPSHMCNLEPLLDAFPDAHVVWAHRNPVSIIASASSVGCFGRRGFYGRVDPKEMGRRVEEKFHVTVTEAMRARDRIGNDRFYDMNYEALVKDIPGAVRDVKERFGLPHDQETDRAVCDFLALPRKDKPGGHKYKPEDFGLELERILDRNKKYIERFGIDVG